MEIKSKSFMQVYVSKRNKEEQKSRISQEQNEPDNFLQEIYDRKKESESNHS